MARRGKARPGSAWQAWRIMGKMEKIMFRVGKGALIPADRYSFEKLRERKYSTGDLVSVQIGKCRNPQFHRLAHAIGTLCVENIEDFEGMNAHSALKRIQIEGNISCSEMMLKIPGLGAVIQRIPRSLSFESMDEEEFRETVRGMCRHIASQYWPGMDADEIERMAEVMVHE